MPEAVKTYQPDNSLRKGYFSIFREIVDEIVENRWLTWQLFKRDFLTIYKQSFIGVLWAFIIPLVSVGTFVLLNQSGIFVFGEIGIPYPIYAVLGMAFWQLFSTGLIASSNSLAKARTMITKINFSKKSLVIASMGQALVSFLIQFGLVVALFAFYGIAPSPLVALVPILIIPILFFTLGLGFILSLLNGIVRDVGNMLSVLITFLMFLTPILYAKPTEGLLAVLTVYNPLYYLAAAPRDIVLMNRVSEIGGFVASSILAVAVFILCLIIFHLTETRVAERV